MKTSVLPLPLLLSLLCLPAFAEPRTVTLVTKVGLGDQQLIVPENQSAEIEAYGPFTNPSCQVLRNGISLGFADVVPKQLVFGGPVKILLPEPGAGSPGIVPWITVRLTPETVDANKVLVLGPTTNNVVVSYQSSSNLVDWTTITNLAFQGIPGAQFFRVTATPNDTP